MDVHAVSNSISRAPVAITARNAECRTTRVTPAQTALRSLSAAALTGTGSRTRIPLSSSADTR